MKVVQKITCAIILLLVSNAFAFDKSLIIVDQYIDYEIPDAATWAVQKKQMSVDSPIQMIKITNNNQLSLEAMFVQPKDDSFLAKQKNEQSTKTMQTLSCSQYIKGSEEGRDTRKAYQSDFATGYISRYTDKNGEGFKYITCVTYVLKTQKKSAIALNVTLLSADVLGDSYINGMKIINSFRIRQ